MDKSLIEKLKEVIQQHQKQTGERVNFLYVDWHLNVVGAARIAKVEVKIEK